MNYVLNVRAFFDIKSKDKAVAHAERLFPHLPIGIVGKYYKDDSLWEATLQQDCQYGDDKTALWETLTYFSEISRRWQIVIGPLEDDTIISAVAENPTIPVSPGATSSCCAGSRPHEITERHRIRQSSIAIDLPVVRQAGISADNRPMHIQSVGCPKKRGSRLAF